MNLCGRCFKPETEGEHGIGLCPFEPRRGEAATVIGDEWPGGGSRTFYNLDHVPHTFANKTEWRRKMKELGVTPYGGRYGVHQGDPGSDKNKFTTRWT